MIVKARREDLRFVFKPPKSSSVNDTVAIALEVVPIGVGEFRISPALGTLNRKPEAGQHKLSRRNFAEGSNCGPAHRPPLGTERLKKLARFRGILLG